jgi:hypothetical protein
VSRSRLRGRRLVVLGLLWVLAAVSTAVGMQAAKADFVAVSVSASQPVASGVLERPTQLAAGQGPCVNNRSAAVALSWVPSASSFAAGYAIWRSTAGGAYQMVGTAGPGSATGWTDTTVAFSTSYAYEVTSLRDGWTSAPAGPVAITTHNRGCH